MDEEKNEISARELIGIQKINELREKLKF